MVSSYDSPISNRNVCCPPEASPKQGLGTPNRKSRIVGGVVVDGVANISLRSLVDSTGGVLDSNNNSFSTGHDILSLSRRRPRAISGGRMDPSSAMHRLCTGMVGNDGMDSNNSDNNGGDNDSSRSHNGNDANKATATTTTTNRKNYSDNANENKSSTIMAVITQALHQIPAVALIGIFHLMVGIPFGVSYFPMYWSSHPGDTDIGGGGGGGIEEEQHDEGKFPIPGKEALGIRMFLFSTLVGQIVFAYFSGFKNPIGLQMVENIGFTKELATIAISHQGYGLDALSTTMVMFGISSLLVGTVFFLLGYFKMGKIIYFFPTHVLIGLIGGIGILLCKTGLENTLANTVSISSMIEGWNHWIIVVTLEIILRFLEYLLTDSKGNPRFALLSPIFFCMITPCFYFAMFILNIPISVAKDAGYFFPSLSNLDDNANDEGGVSLSVEFGTPWDLWKVIDFSKVSWKAILDSFPTMLALVLFSLIHVPINIPAFSLSTKVDVDMNQELIAHGLSNMLSGAGGGLQNYMAYTQSVLYDKSGGTGRYSGLAVALVTGILFFVGPDIASHIPRCMAGALLLHVGIDLFLEGVVDSWRKFDLLEYAGIWLIVIVMSVSGMEAAMVAGGIAAVSTYAVQNVAYLSPIRGVMPATTLRSSHWNRVRLAETTILSDSVLGRSRILVVQLQGHLFFGNMAFFTDQMKELLCPLPDLSKSDGIGNIDEEQKREPIVLIMDCTLVLGIDSSAARAIVKLKDTILKEYKIQLCIFVTGTIDGFPTEFDLREKLSTERDIFDSNPSSEDTSLLAKQIKDEEEKKVSRYTGSCVRDSLDLALMEAEDALIARHNPSLLEEDDLLTQFTFNFQSDALSSIEEKEEFISSFKVVCPVNISDEEINLLFLSFEREVFREGDLIWKQNDKSDCVKLLILGQLIAELENEAGTKEVVPKGSIIGELGLVNGDPRMSTVKCTSKEAVLYSINRERFEILIEQQPKLARYIDLICVKYLTLRVQHVSNRIFETRCLPI